MGKINEFSWKVGGPAGFGIMSTGLIFSKIYGTRKNTPGNFLPNSERYLS